MIRIKFNILIGMLCFLLSSCLIGEDNNSGTDASGQVDVTFSVTLPQPETVTTRAGMPYSDTDIKTVDVLVFNQLGQFMNRIKVDESALTVTSSGVNFSVRLDATPDKRIIHLIANGRTADGVTDRFDFARWMVPGKSEVQSVFLLSTVVTDNSGLLADITPLVMWGRTVINEVSAVSSASVKLLRTVAAVQVKTANVAPDNGLSDFQIKKIALTDAPTEGFLTPNNYLSSDFTPSDAYPVVGSPVWDLAKSWSGEGTPTLYTYERDYSASALSVIVSAVYKGQAGFYKVVLADENEVPLKVIRNHRYTFIITKVDGPGYADLNTAVTSAPSNAIKVSLTDEDEDFPCIVADGQYIMGLSNNSLVRYGSSGAVELGTVYSSRGVQPVLSIPADCNWLDQLNAVAIGGNKYKITGRFKNGRDVLHTTLTLTCDNLSQTMEVDWDMSVSTGSRDGDSYAVPLFGDSDENWVANVITRDDPNGMFLSVSPNPGDFTFGGGLDKMVNSLNSIYAPKAYLHFVTKDGKGNGTVKVSTSVAGKAISRRISVVYWQ